MSDLIRVGIVGCGVGRQHAVELQKLPAQFQVMAVCDIEPDKARSLAAEQAIPHVVAGIDEMCRLDDVDVIDICTPSYLHYEQTLQVLAADKHVICEKPVAGSLKEVDELIAAEACSGKRIMPIFQYRFGAGLQKLKFLVDEGVTGRAYVSTVETLWRRRPEYYAAPWRGKWKTELGGQW